MARRFHPRSSPGENLRIFIRSVPWKLLVLVPLLVVLAIPTYIYGLHLGNALLPNITKTFYNLSAPAPAITPTPLPSFPHVLPQAGSLLYTVQDGDACDDILVYKMHMLKAGEVFTDVKPETVKALNNSLNQDCQKLQPGMILPLSPHYPLVAFGGAVLKIESSTTKKVLPTPLIHVNNRQDTGPDCTGGCLLTLRLAPQVQVQLVVKTGLPIRINSWIWAQATLARKTIPGFDAYPYADPNATMNGMTLRACNLQVDDTYDDDSLSCSSLTPNSIKDDRGSWLFSVTGASALDHWHYTLPSLPKETPVLMWLSLEHGNLNFKPGNALYRYDNTTHVYVDVKS